MDIEKVIAYIRDRPEWESLDAAITSMLTISQKAQAMLFLHGEITPRGDFYQELVAALDDIMLPHHWEFLSGLLAVMKEEPGTNTIVDPSPS